MKTPISFLTRLLILLIFSSHIHLSSSFTQTDNQIFDLESLDEAGFIAEANYWNASSLRDGVTKDFFCYNKFLLGGYNILSFNTPSVKQYFNRTYTGLPPHNMILFSFLFQPIDSWDGAPDNDHVDIWFDTTSFSSWMLQFGSSLSSYLCGNPIFPEYPGIVTIIQVAHSAPTLTVKVVNQLNEDTTNESFGFRNIEIIFYNSTNLTNSFCGQASFTLPSMACPCPSTKHYMSPVGSGTCYACDSSCGTCSGPLSTNCLTCDPGSYLSASKCLNCSSSCLTCNGGTSSNCLTCPAGYFLFTNNTCISECPYPMVQSSNGIIQYCSTPCNPTPYLLWDQTCSSSCDPPLTTTTFFTLEFCVYPCSPTQYLYWNGTCAATCNSPLSKSTSHNRLYCNYPCTSGYLYWDGTCNPSCNSPLTPVTIALNLYCTKPCPDGQYLYWNGSCISSCNAPLSIASPSVVPVCNFPCSPTSLILYWDGSCGSTCNSPLVLKTEGIPIRNFCTFNCSIGEFLYWNGTCSSVCIPPLTYSYQNGRSFCHYPCTTGQYLHWNGTCQGACNPPLVPRPEATLKYCDFPCDSSDYLYWNGTCLPSCDAPLLSETQGSAKFCYFPCSSTSNFLYYNGTCASQCLSPLKPKTEGTPSRNFCNGPCSNLSEYYTWYGTCTATCNPPLTKTIEYQVNFCGSSCTASQYLYWNGSCLANCDSPLTPRIVNSAKFCDFPCESQSFYLNWDGTCSLSCPGSSIVSLEGTGSNLRRFCRYGCSNNDYLYWNGSCLSTCPSPFRQSTSGTYNFCGSPCVTPSDFYYENTGTCSSQCNSPYVINDTTSYPSCVKIEEEGWIVSHVLTSSAGSSDFSLITLVKMMHYIKYLDINMPPRLERLILSKAKNIFSLQFGYSLANSSDFSEEKLATVFEKYGLPSDFLVNFWQELTIFGIFILLALGFTALENICKIYGWKIWGHIFERLRGITRWNMLIIAMLASVDDIILYSSFQFKTFSASFSSTFTVISLFVCTLTNAVIVLLIGLMIFMAVKLQQAKKGSNPNNEDQNCLDRFKDFQVLFEGFHHNTLFKQLFYLIYIVRLALPMVVASYFSIWPLYQMITQVSLSGVIIMYIICARPLQKQVNNVQLIITETLTLGMNACVLLLTIRDYNGIEQSNLDVILGDLVIFGNFLTNIVLIVFLIIKLLIEGNNIYKGLKGSSSSKPKTAWIHLLVVPIQQGGLGFEEINPTLYEEPPIINFNKLGYKGSFVPLSGQENKIMKNLGYLERKGDMQRDDREEYELESEFGSRRKGSSNPTRDVTPGFVANTTPHSSPSFPRFDLDEPVMKLEDFMTQTEEVEVRDDFVQEKYDTSSRGYYLDSYGRRKR